MLMNNALQFNNNEHSTCCLLSSISYEYLTLKRDDVTFHILGDLVCALHTTEDTLFLAFKGTTSVKDIIYDISLIQIDDSFGIPGKLHKGFYELFKKNYIELVDIIKSHNKSKIYITGHSLGASLAQICFTYLKLTKILPDNTQLHLVTFGSPRVGDKEYINFINSQENVCLYVNKKDIIAKLPVFFNYFSPESHIIPTNCKCYFPCFKHHSVQYYYDNIATLP